MSRITLTLFALFVAACSFAQTADNLRGCAPLTVQFTAPATATTFFWDFKDGVSSLLRDPVNTFTAPGDYDVEFRATQGGPVVGTLRIKVYPKPDLAIKATPTGGCAPLTVFFTDESKMDTAIKVLQRQWTYGDGGGATGSPNPNYVYTQTGSFDVALRIQTNLPGCDVAEANLQNIRVSSKPAVNFTTNPPIPTACQAPLTVAFTNTTQGGGLTFNWNLGNGVTSQATNAPAQTYAQNGAYRIRLTATDAFGCADSIVKLVSVGPPLATFNVRDTVCINSPVLFENNSAFGSYQWTFGPNANPATSTGFSPSVEFSTPGTRTITLLVTAPGGCSTTATKTIYVDQVNPNFSVSPRYACSRPATFTITSASTTPGARFDWRFSDGSTSTSPNPTYVWQDPDSTGFSSSALRLDTIELIVTNPSGCSADAIRVDSIWLPNALFRVDKWTGCAPLTVNFTDFSNSNEPIVSWTWTFGDGSAPVTQANSNAVNHIYDKPGEYQARLNIRNSAGCVDTSYAVTIEVGEKLTADFNAAPTKVCPGDTVSFEPLITDPRIDSWHFYSDKNRQWHCPNDKNPKWQYISDAGPTDVVLAVEYNGCYNEISKKDFITVQGPIAEIGYKTTCANTLEFEFTDLSKDATSIKWYLGDGDSTDQKTFKHVYDSSGTYRVVLKAENLGTGCPASYDTAYVYPTELKAAFDLKDIICAGSPQKLDASKSTDVNGVCHKGYTWYFTFQRPIRTDTAVTDFTFNTPGAHLVWLEVEDINGCRDTIRDSINVFNGTPKFKASDSLFCLPATINFMDTGSEADTTIVKWEWDFGDGGMATGQMATHQFNQATSNPIVVSYTITDAVECPYKGTLELNIYKPTSRYRTDPLPPNICAGESISFTATDFVLGGSNLRWKWTFDNSATATGQTVTQQFNREGAIPVKMVYTEIATGCTDSLESGIFVQVPPDPMITTNPAVICPNEPVQFIDASLTNSPPLTVVWDLGNGVRPTGPTATRAFPKGTYTIKMTASTPFGCTDSTSYTFTVLGPEGDFDLDKSTICRGGAVNLRLKDTSDVRSFSWEFGDGTPVVQNQASPAHTYGWSFFPNTGTTVVKLRIEGRESICPLTVQKPLSFSRIDAAFDVGANPLCLGATHSFRNASTAADDFAWTFGDGNTSTAANPTHKYGALGEYTVRLIVTDQPLGCKDTAENRARIVNANSFAALGDSICAGGSALLTVPTPVPNVTYTWSPAALVTSPTGNSVRTVPILRDTTLSVSYADAIGCVSVATVQVEVGEDPEVFYPNAFTPNGDEINDSFKLLLKESACSEAEVEYLRIYNRWGKLIFEDSGPIGDVKWDGRLPSGEDATSDGVVWYAEVRFKSGNVKTFKGDLHLIR